MIPWLKPGHPHFRYNLATVPAVLFLRIPIASVVAILLVAEFLLGRPRMFGEWLLDKLPAFRR